MVRLEIHQGSTRSDVTGVISQSVSKAVIELGGLRPGLFNPGAVGPGSSLSGSCGTGSLDFSFFFIFIRCIVDAYIAGGPFDFKKRTGTAKAQEGVLKRRVAPVAEGGADVRRGVVVPATAAIDAVCSVGRRRPFPYIS